MLHVIPHRTREGYITHEQQGNMVCKQSNGLVIENNTKMYKIKGNQRVYMFIRETETTSHFQINEGN